MIFWSLLWMEQLEANHIVRMEECSGIANLKWCLCFPSMWNWRTRIKQRCWLFWKLFRFSQLSSRVSLSWKVILQMWSPEFPLQSQGLCSVRFILLVIFRFKEFVQHWQRGETMHDRARRHLQGFLEWSPRESLDSLPNQRRQLKSLSENFPLNKVVLRKHIKTLLKLAHE